MKLLMTITDRLINKALNLGGMEIKTLIYVARVKV